MAYLAALTLGLTLFQQFEPFLNFCQWLQPIVYYWRLYVYQFFDLIFFWLPFSLPAFFKDILALAVLAVALASRVNGQLQKVTGEHRDEMALIELDQKLSWFRKTMFLPSVFIVAVFLTPVFGWNVNMNATPNDASSLGALFNMFAMLLRCLTGIALIAILILVGDGLESRVGKGFFSKHMWRVSTVFLALLTINFVGLYADEIRGVNQPNVEAGIHLIVAPCG